MTELQNSHMQHEFCIHTSLVSNTEGTMIMKVQNSTLERNKTHIAYDLCVKPVLGVFKMHSKIDMLEVEQIL